MPAGELRRQHGGTGDVGAGWGRGVEAGGCGVNLPSGVSHDPTMLPEGLPAPVDDGLAAHLWRVGGGGEGGAALPRVGLRSTSGPWVNLAALERPTVIFFYPRTGVPGQPPARGFAGEAWEEIPGARGCTPQACGFGDLHGEFRRLGVDVLGISTNTSEHQREFKSRMLIPYELLSDSELTLTRAMKLPTFRFPVESGGPSELIKRMAWFVERTEGTNEDARGQVRIQRLWYPVFPPDRNAATVLDFVRARMTVTIRPIGPGDSAFVRSELKRNWGTTTIWSRRLAYQADKLPGMVAWRNGGRVGLLTLAAEPPCPAGEGEVVTLSSLHDGQGIGTMLLDAAAAEGRRLGLRRLVLTTSNDNLRALGLYQRRGWRLSGVHLGVMDEYRRAGWRLPERSGGAGGGIPIRDELELELPLAAAEERR